MDPILRYRCLECNTIVEERASATLSALSMALQTERSILCLCTSCSKGRPKPVTQNVVTDG